MAAEGAGTIGSADLCTEAEIGILVHSLYGRIREDAVLGPIFERHVRDWDAHLAKMVDFWSSVLRRTARYRGLPMPAHRALPNLSIDLFKRWLTIFQETTAGLANCAMQERADELALRLAQSLWHGYRTHRIAAPQHEA